MLPCGATPYLPIVTHSRLFMSCIYTDKPRQILALKICNAWLARACACHLIQMCMLMIVSPLFCLLPVKLKQLRSEGWRFEYQSYTSTTAAFPSKQTSASNTHFQDPQQHIFRCVKQPRQNLKIVHSFESKQVSCSCMQTHFTKPFQTDQDIRKRYLTIKMFRLD